MKGLAAVCGVVGLHLKDPDLHERLGRLLVPMLGCLIDRGPDSAGMAVYGQELPEGCLRWSLRVDDTDADWYGIAAAVAAEMSQDVAEVTVQPYGPAATLTVTGSEATVRRALTRAAPGVRVVGYGRAVEIFKDVGAADSISQRYRIPERAGYQGVGHTRMATESAVTTDHSHPFAPSADLCLVHNGSFSNYPTVRRKLAREGVAFDTDNDSEVAARFIARRQAEGADLGDALRLVLKEFDGFFTLLVTTRTEFAVVRDSFACKPAVVAETDGYVAMASEYRALAHLPRIGDAEVFEPKPEEIYLWAR